MPSHQTANAKTAKPTTSNRLVAGTLEVDWNDALRALQAAQDDAGACLPVQLRRFAVVAEAGQRMGERFNSLRLGMAAVNRGPELGSVAGPTGRSGFAAEIEELYR